MVFDLNLPIPVDIAYNAAEKLVDELSTFVGETRPPVSVVMMSSPDADYQRGRTKRQTLWDERASSLRENLNKVSSDIDQLEQLFKPIEGIMTTALYPVERFEYRTDGEMFAYKSLWKTADEMRSWVYGYISLLQCEPKQKSLDQEYQILLKKRPVDASILKSIVERLKYEREIIREHLSKSFTDHPQMEIRAEALAAVEGLGESLDENSKIILQAMYELKCNELNRMSAGEIITTALYKGDEKRCFNQLKRLELVATKQGRNGGCWLTTKGSSIASKLNGGTVIPTDCTV